MTTLVQRVARRGRSDGLKAFLRHGPGAPAEDVAAAWLLGRRRSLVADAEQRLYLVAFVDSWNDAAAGRAAHTPKE